MEKNLPIKIFEKRKSIDDRKTEAGRSGKLPAWVLPPNELIIRAQEINKIVTESVEILRNRNEQRDFIPAVIRIGIKDDAIAKSHRSEINTIFNTSGDYNIIGFTNDCDLLIKIDDVRKAGVISKKLSQPVKYNVGISAISEAEAFKPLIDINDFDSSVKVQLLNFHNYELNNAVERTFQNICLNKNIKYQKLNYSNELILYKLSNVTADSIIDITDFEAIESIVEMPLYNLVLDEITSTEPAISIKYPVVGTEYPTIGILDSGIKNIDHLNPWILPDKFSKIPKDRINPSHGTFVSGVVLYGDDLENENYVGSDGCYLFDATVFPDSTKETIEEWELIEHIREAITKNKSIKIWNLSIGTRIECGLTDFSDFAKALDQIQEANDVIICKSAGNCDNYKRGKPKSRISYSADSVRSLVVGSVAQNKNTTDLADKHHPSPFTRIGKGPNGINKPELTHMGGNAGFDSSGKIVYNGVKSFDINGNIVSNCGTSFSTPRVASLLAGIDHKLDEKFNPLLLKCLAIHSAKYPSNLNLQVPERIKQMGYGIPDKVEDIIYNSSNEITLILQDTLERGNFIEITDFPFPQSMVENGFFYGEIIVTLVAAPMLNESNGAEYCQSNMDVKLGTYDSLKTRDTSMATIRNEIGFNGAKNILKDSCYTAKHKKDILSDFARERLLVQYEDKFQPIKKYAVNLEEMTESHKVKYLATPKKWYLKIQGLFRDFVTNRAAIDGYELSQEFCLIITIRDNKNKHNVYNEASQLLTQHNFIHSNVNIKGNVRVPVNQSTN